ncbi:hypothetical protein CVT24_000163 [Panaeolus cyanescens]|uniref:Arrestin-like N-terminal domain-containing protein n=1 Tax=Panaeolus cyanescens TaxID=181874 RepID=A0A409VIY2_9AGAR|nr:hypothetical protein CVT24_000163 [Panaeolus cyanescens]
MSMSNGLPEYRSLQHTSSRRHAAGNDLPPAYITIFADPQEELPPDAQPTRHQYTSSWSGLLSKSKKPWLVLDLITRSTTTPQWLTTPRYFGGDNISGTVGLKLDSVQSIASIVILLKGRIITSFEQSGSFIFLQYTHPIWKKSDGDPRVPSMAGTSSFNGKLVGEYEFSFSFPFPTEANLAECPGYKTSNPRRGSSASRGEVNSVFPCPQTFLERNLPINIEYELVLQVHHGLLRPDTKIKTPVVFIPKITPEPYSLMRAEAYAQSALLPSPLSDPEGWHASNTLNITGTTASGAKIDLYLATPLSYTRGTVIPCYVTIVCEDPDVLKDLSNAKVQQVKLTRTVRFFSNPPREIDRHLKDNKPSVRKEVDEIDIASWWRPSKDVAQENTCSILEGEIHLAKTLVPSSEFLPFSVEYSVEMQPPKSKKFKYHELATPTQEKKTNELDEDCTTPDNDPATILISQPIVIATFNASGPRPTPFTERRDSVALRRRRGGFDSENLASNYTGVTYW